MKIIMLGAPGAGKGTQAKMIAEKYAIPHVSTGDIFRANIKNGTELGAKAKEYMDKGLLVPDELVVDLIMDRFKADDCKNGYILDGFPRTIPQAEALDNIVDVDIAILIDVDEQDVRDRALSRRTCEDCGEIYNIHTYDKDTCAKCGGKLYIRSDAYKTDERIDTYNREAKPLVDYYRNKGILQVVDTRKFVSDNVEDQINGIFNHIVNLIGEIND